MKNLPKKLVLISSLSILFLTAFPAVSQTPPPTVAIHTIQGVKSTTAEVVSPYVGQTVQTSGIVTAITAAGFFIQEPDGSGAPALAPTGIFVSTGSGAVPSSVVIGNNLQVTGTVSTFPTLTTQSHIPATEIGGTLTISVLSTSNALPTPIVLTASNLSASGSIYQLTPYEGMRVSFSSLTATSGTGGTLNEASETYTSNGQFYAVITGTSRPFREPGIDQRDAPVPGAPSGIATFDDNPERILIDSGTLVGSTPIDVSTGAVLASVTGVLDFTASYDSTYVPARLLIDPSYSTSNITPGMTVQPAPTPGAKTFTVAAFDVGRLFNASSSDDIYYVPAGVAPNTGTSAAQFPSSAVDVTSTAAYQRRLQKIALAICNMLHAPDIVALEEIENQSVAADIATQVATTCSVNYNAYGTDNSHFYTWDSTGISVGFLANTATVDVSSETQIGQNESFTPTGASAPITANDRPWLAIQAGIKRTNALDYPITVIVNDMQSLEGENSATSTATREKREKQAEEIAGYIQSQQAKHFHVISVGDFNAFEFSDGYTDTLATYTNSALTSPVVLPGKSGLVTPPLNDLTLAITQKDQRWSYVQYGNAEVLDHIVITSELASTSTFNYAHFNADFPAVDYNDATTAARASDHDAAVGYFTIPPPTLSAFVSPSSAAFPSTAVGVASTGQVFTISNTGEAPFSITSISATTTGSGNDFSETNNCGATSPPNTLAPGASCTANVVFTPSAAGARSGSFSVLTTVNSSVLTAPLTGTGAAADFTLTDSTGKTTTSVTVAAGATGSATLVFTPLNGFNAAIASTCSAQGVAPAGVTCTAPATFTLSGTAAVNQTVSFATTARTSSGGFALGSVAGSPWSATALLTLIGLVTFLAGRTRRLARIAGLLTLLLALFLPAIGCGGKGSGGGGGGTPAGSYTYNVTATSGAITHTETVTLVVQ